MSLSTTDMFSLLALVCFVGLMVWAAIGDARTFLITNKLNTLIVVTFVLLCLPMGLSHLEIWAHVKVALLVSLVALGLFWVGIYGGGDCKMTGAVALWLGPAPLMNFVLFTAIAGGALTIILLLARWAARHTGLPKSPRWIRRLMRRKSGVPYGIALGIGAILATPSALWFPSFLR